MKVIPLFLLILTMPLSALTIRHQIDSPDGCPDKIHVEVREHAGDLNALEYIITLKSRKLSAMKMTTQSRGLLEIKSGRQFVAQVPLNPDIRKNGTTFRFQVTRKVLSGSKLTISTVLCAENGILVVGGGEIFELDLLGFLPDELRIVD